MTSKAEAELLEQHFRTTQLIRANLLASRERLFQLPQSDRRDRLLALQHQALEAMTTTVDLCDNALVHLRGGDRVIVSPKIAVPNVKMA